MAGFRNRQEAGGPVTIKDEGLTLVDNVGSIDFVGAGVSGDLVGVDVTETIPGGGGTYTPETPVGVVNGANAVFTITSANLFALYLNGAFQTAGGVDYTLVGTTITYVSAPPTGSGHRAMIYT